MTADPWEPAHPGCALEWPGSQRLGVRRPQLSPEEGGGRPSELTPAARAWRAEEATAVLAAYESPFFPGASFHWQLERAHPSGSPDLAPCSGKPSHLTPPAPWRQQSGISKRMSFLLLGLNWLVFVLFLIFFFKHPPCILNYTVFETIFLHMYRHTHLFIFSASGIVLCICTAVCSSSFSHVLMSWLLAFCSLL